MTNKITILTLGDDPRHLSGVAHCLKDIGNALLKTGKFRIISLGAAIQHLDYRPVKIKDDWVIIPVEGFGNIDQVKAIIRDNNVQMILFQSDPRFYDWLLTRDNEIRPEVPMIWYTVWDNYPYPLYNDWVWHSVDVAVAISKLTEDLISVVSPKTELHYQPHCIDQQTFKKISDNEIQQFIKDHVPEVKDKFVVFWNNRNGRRKNGASLIVWFKTFLDKIGHDKAVLLMHTDPIDPQGFNLPELIHGFGLQNKVLINPHKVEENVLAKFYNLADCTINISHSEGFGMGTLESLSCGTPIIANWTGGMREQLCDIINNPSEWYGIPVFPVAKTIVGSPELPWIYEDQVNEEGVVQALLEMYSLTKEERKQWGLKGIEHINKNFNFNNFEKFWSELLLKVHKERGDHPNKSYIKWTGEEFECKQKFESTKLPTELPPSAHINRLHFEKFMNSLNLQKNR